MSWARKRGPLGAVLVPTLALATATAALAQVPARLPSPDGQPGDSSLPVQVYVLAGQSNMVGMGDLAGAQNRYAGAFLSPDPAVPAGRLGIHRVGDYRFGALGVFQSAEPEAEPGAVALLESEDSGLERVALPQFGWVTTQLPESGGRRLRVRGFLEVPISGLYSVHPGFGSSTANVARVGDTLVHQRGVEGRAATQDVRLEAGQRTPFEVEYAAGGSMALWLQQEDLAGNGDLEAVVRRDGRFPWLLDASGAWSVRQDVRYQEARLAEGGTGSMLSATSNGKSIGPELGFGHVMGEFHEAPVLLIKTAQGNRSLGFDFRPPSSGRTDPDSEWESAEYALMLKGVRETLARLDELVPGYQGQGYELAGFAWWQGHKDGGSPEAVAAYEQHLVHLIQDVRRDLEAPDLPVVVATVGFGGDAMSEAHLGILDAQLAVGDPERHPEFAGTVATIDTRPFWRSVDESPRDQGHHYHRNAETYMLTGDALGRAMVALKGGTAEPLPEPPRSGLAVAPAAPGDHEQPAAQAALRPMLVDGIASEYARDRRHGEALRREARHEEAARPTQFLRDAMFGLANVHRAAGETAYDWRPFGPDLREREWHFQSFDPPEALPPEKGPRFRSITWPSGMEGWREPGFDAKAAGWGTGLPPFGQLDGELVPLSSSCGADFCGCSVAPRTLWEHEVLMLRGTFEFPPLRPDRRYRLVVGGSAHVAAGEGFTLAVNGKVAFESRDGVGRRQGGQPRGARITQELREEFARGPVTLSIHSFLRTNTPRGPIPPRGHLSVWVEEAGIPPLPQAEDE